MSHSSYERKTACNEMSRGTATGGDHIEMYGFRFLMDGAISFLFRELRGVVQSTCLKRRKKNVGKEHPRNLIAPINASASRLGLSVCEDSSKPVARFSNCGFVNCRNTEVVHSRLHCIASFLSPTRRIPYHRHGRLNSPHCSEGENQSLKSFSPFLCAAKTAY